MDKQIEEFYRFLDYCGDTEHRNVEFQGWIKKSKYYINQIIENDSFPELFDNYINTINKRFKDIDNQINSIKDKLDKYNFPTDIEIIFAPNLLQSKYLADYLLIDNKLYIISADFSEKTVIHEYLHIIAKRKHQSFKSIIEKYGIKFTDIEKMVKIGYIKDLSAKSQIHTFEEFFVRTYTSIILNTPNDDKAFYISKNNINILMIMIDC